MSFGGRQDVSPSVGQTFLSVYESGEREYCLVNIDERAARTL
ncbi:MAG TPA: hypothetical protein VM095_20730 [Pyrinomonadaceae bacterium]|nr:hypothetical protein [Pyrinomonadaceae bacterium]